MSKTYNWGIIGLGHIAHKFAADLTRLPNARLHAVASTSQTRAQAFADQYNVPFFYNSYQEIVNCPDLDIVYIATPHSQHCTNTLMCLEHQLAVLCEKPLAMNATEVRRMITLAQFQNTFLMEAIWTRFLPSIKKVVELIDEGAIGEVQSVKADFGFNAPFQADRRLFNQSLGGGSLMDVGIYPVFLALLILGKPASVKAVASIGRSNVDESCGILFKYRNNKMAMLHCSIVTQTPTEAYIYGEKGSIRINTRWHEPTSLTLLLNDAEPKDFFFEYPSQGYHYEAEEVMRCLGEGRAASEMLSLDFSLDLIELLDQIRTKAGIYYPIFDHMPSNMVVSDDPHFSMN